MKTETTRLILAMLLSVTTTATAQSAAESRSEANVGRNYYIVDLATVSSTNVSFASMVSDSGTIAGSANGHIAFWHGTLLYDLGPPPSGSGGEAIGVNNSGQLAGDYFNFAKRTSVPFWVPIAGGMPQLLPTLSAPYARASAINDWGLVAGTALVDSNDPYDDLAGQRAVVWLRGAIRDLGTLGGPSAIADTEGNLNDFGVVVGASDLDSRVNPTFGGYLFHATMWTDTTRHPVAHDLGALAKTKDNQVSLATSINNFGQIVGWSLTDIPDVCFSGTQQWGFVWEDGKMRGLPPLAGDCDARATMGNIFGLIIGNSIGIAADGTEITRAVVWENGKAIDLTSLLPPDSGWKIDYAAAVNDRGEIVGSGLNPQGIERAFLMRRR